MTAYTLKKLKALGFQKDELLPLEGDLTGKTLVLNPSIVKPCFRNRDGLVWRADSGFGCSPESIGRAVFAVCLYDNEKARFSRSEFIAILKTPEAPAPTTA